ncbi:MAG: biopolymer transporter ExbD [Myxococcota bacterium]|nr:biopolymer transporter ExbD [Myxococcota bacterium]
MLFGRYKRAREELEVNLIPVMNLFVTLIPFLLLAAAFYHVGVIPTSLPSQTDETSDVAGDTQSVTVNLVIEREQLHVSAANAVLDETLLAALSMTIEKGDEGFDLKLLTKVLHEIKKRFTKSDTVIVLPSDYVEYQDVVRILDATREIKLDGESETSKRLPLFPVVVLSRKV